MLKNLLLFFLLLYPLSQHAQTRDSVESDGNLIINLQKISFDSIWNHKMEEADLILKIEIKRKYFMTFYGLYIFDVIEEIKGDFMQSSGRFELGLVDFSPDAFEKKYRALDSNIVYVGFKKITEENPSGYFMTDTLTGIKWEFWMSTTSEKNWFNSPLMDSLFQNRDQGKVTEFDFCHRILVHPYSVISSKEDLEAKIVVLKKKWHIEDSLFDIAETKRCAVERDSLRLIRDFEKDSLIEGELTIINQSEEDINIDSRQDYYLPEHLIYLGNMDDLDSLLNEIDSIDTSLDTSIHLNHDFEKDSVVEGELIFFNQYTEDMLYDSNKDMMKDFEKDSLEYIDFWMLDPFDDEDCVNFGEMDSLGILRGKPEGISQMEEEIKRKILDSLVNVIEPIDTSLDTSIRVNSDFEKELSEFGKIYTGDTTTKEMRALRNFRVLEYSLADLERRSQVDSLPKYSPSDFSFYPNPASGFITMEFKNIQGLSGFDIVDVKGRIIAREKITGISQTLDVSSFHSGVYFIVLNSGYRVRKLIVE